MTTTTAPNPTTATSNGTQVTTVLTVSKIASGRTEPGATNWNQGKAPSGDSFVSVYVDTSAAGFTKTPIYVTSLGGDVNQYGTTGASSVYEATATGFKILIRWDKDYSKIDLTPELANSYKWHINWIAIEPFSQAGQGNSTQTSPTTAQKTPLPATGKDYYLGNKKSSKYLDVKDGSTTNGAILQQYSLHKGDNQQWRLEDAGNSYYYLVCKKSGKYASIVSGSTDNGAKLHQWEKVNADDLKWQLEDAGDGYFYLINKKSGKYACITSGSTADSAAAHQWEKVNADDLKWKFEAV